MARQAGRAGEVYALTRLYDLILWIIPVLEKFPRSQKFLLGDRMETQLLDIQDLLIQAAYSGKKVGFFISGQYQDGAIAIPGEASDPGPPPINVKRT